MDCCARLTSVFGQVNCHTRSQVFRASKAYNVERAVGHQIDGSGHDCEAEPWLTITSPPADSRVRCMWWLAVGHVRTLGRPSGAGGLRHEDMRGDR